jgi:hypothetical protein
MKIFSATAWSACAARSRRTTWRWSSAVAGSILAGEHGTIWALKSGNGLVATSITVA